jgi:O-antigen/teichoic acid export membrane protein
LSHIAISSVVSALVTWLVLVLAARELGPMDYAHFMVVWGTFFAATSILSGLQQEVTRSVARAQRSIAGSPLILGTTLVGGGGAVLLVFSGQFWGARVLGPTWSAELVVLGIAFAGYAIANLITGALAARGSWDLYSGSILLEGLARALAVASVLVAGAGDTAWALAFTAGLLGWVALGFVSARARDALFARGDSQVKVFTLRSSQAVVAAACSAIAISGFPVLLRLTTQGDLGAPAGVLMVVVVSTRAPLLLLNSFQGPIIARLVALDGQVTAIARRWIWSAVMSSVGIALGAFLAGPLIITSVFGPGFRPSRELVAALAIAAVFLGVLTLTGWIALVRAAHKAFVAGWIGAIVGIVAILLLDLPLEARAVSALVVGPALGVSIHVLLLTRLGRALAAPAPS